MQKNAFLAGLILSLALLGGFLLSGYFLFRSGIPPMLTVPAYAAPLLGPFLDGVAGGSLLHLASVLGGILLVLPMGTLFTWQMRNLYWRTGSLEVFYFAVFTFSLSLEGLRMLVLLLFVRDAPLELRLILTRLVYLGRILGLFGLLTSSLYAVGLKYDNQGLLMGLLFLLSFTLASIVPLDATAFTEGFLYRLGDLQGYFFVTVALQVLFVLNYAGASLLRASPRFLLVALAAAMVFSGRELFLYGSGPFSVGAGVALLAGGGVFFHRQIGLFYLWI